jgi:hypothetical protein
MSAPISTSSPCLPQFSLDLLAAFVAFEPSAENVERLRANLAYNDFKNVMVIEKAVKSRAGEVEFFINNGNSGGKALGDIGQWPGYVPENGTPVHVAVPATTLDAERGAVVPSPKFNQKWTPRAPTNGSWNGASDLLAWQRPRFIISELHQFGLAKMGCSQENLRGSIEDLGYSTLDLTNAGGSLPAATLNSTSLHHQSPV